MSDLSISHQSAPPSKAPGVAVRGARLVYDGTVLFDSLDVTLPAGLCTGLLGPSGVGKSTLLRMIAGLLPAAGGSVQSDDEHPLGDRCAFMAQQDLLLPWATVLENTVLGYRLRGETPPWARARALLADLGLADWQKVRPHALSGGMRQRVALARTLIEDRPLILMDEPFSALDAVTRFRLQNLAARLLTGRTVLLVTHDPLEALRLGHRVLVMNGRPARLSAPIVPAGLPPRDLTDADLQRAHADLLTRLAEDAP